jgi:hypothetical protein
MRWITEGIEFSALHSIATRLITKEDASIQSPTRKMLTFDDAAMCTPSFFNLLMDLMTITRDSEAYQVILDPDPVKYFHRLFGKYPAVEIALHDSPNPTWMS